MENQEQQNDIFGLQFDENAKSTIKTITSWAMIIVVCSLVGYVLAFIKYFKEKKALESMVGSEEFGSSSLIGASSTSNLAGIIISVIVGLLITYFLYQFASKTKKGVETLSQNDVIQGFANFRNYFLTIGIVAIIVIVFVLIAMLAVGAMSN